MAVANQNRQTYASDDVRKTLRRTQSEILLPGLVNTPATHNSASEHAEFRDDTLIGTKALDQDALIARFHEFIRLHAQRRLDHQHNQPIGISEAPPNLPPIRVTVDNDAQVSDQRTVMGAAPPGMPPPPGAGILGLGNLFGGGGGGTTVMPPPPGTTGGGRIITGGGGGGTPPSKLVHKQTLNTSAEHVQTSQTPEQRQHSNKALWILASIAAMAVGGMATCAAVAQTEATDRAILANAKRAHALKLLGTINHNGFSEQEPMARSLRNNYLDLMLPQPPSFAIAA